MKKYWKDQKYRRHKKKHDLKSHRKKLRFFEKRRLRRRHLQGIPFFLSDTDISNRELPSYAIITAPRCFSFVNFPEQTVEFINNIQKKLKDREKIFIRLDRVIDIDNDAIVLLVSTLIKFKEANVRFKGNLPKKEQQKRLLLPLDAKIFLKVKTPIN